MKIECPVCGTRKIDKNAIGLNKKLIGKDVEEFYCLPCLAEYLEVTVDELLAKAEEFKSEGCKLFQ